MYLKFKLRNIDPNPWRRMERYPIRQDKVEALKESITSTDWWGNVIARISPSDPSRAQLAYGHHRRQALLELFDPEYEVELNIQDLSDEQMIKIMARENMEEWGSSAATQHETIRTIVEAIAAAQLKFAGNHREGTHLSIDDVRQIREQYAALHADGNTQADALQILSQDFGVSARSLDDIVNDRSWQKSVRLDGFGGKVRIAPSFIVYNLSELPPETDFEKVYTVRDLANFTGWTQKDGAPQWKVRDALNVLEVIERGLLTEADFEGLSSWQAGKIADKAKQELKTRQELANLETRPEVKAKIITEGHADAADLARHIISDLRSKERGQVHIEESAAASGKMTPRPPKEPPHIDAFAERLASTINNLLVSGPSNKKIQNLELFIKFQDKATPRSRKEIKEVLRQTAARATQYANQLDAADDSTMIAPTILAIEGENE